MSEYFMLRLQHRQFLSFDQWDVHANDISELDEILGIKDLSVSFHKYLNHPRNSIHQPTPVALCTRFLVAVKGINPIYITHLRFLKPTQPVPQPRKPIPESSDALLAGLPAGGMQQVALWRQRLHL